MIKQRITLGGFAGSGKSTVAKMLCEKLGYKFISVGNFSREYAQKEFGLSINEFQEKCKKEPHLDEMIDKKFSDECNNSLKIVVDYRLGFKFVELSFNVFLKVSDEVSVKRLQEANRGNEKKDAVSINQRNLEMRERFLKKYGVDFADESNYHLIIDTDKLEPNEIVNIIIKAFNTHDSY